MPTMTCARAALLVACLTLAQAAARADDTAEFAAKAGETLGRAGAVTAELVTMMDLNGLKLTLRLEVAALPSGQVRQTLESPFVNLEILADDSTTTTVYPALKKYSRQESLPAPLDGPQENLLGMGRKVYSYDSLLEMLGASASRYAWVRVGTDTLSIVQGERVCAVYAASLDTVIVVEGDSIRMQDAKSWFGLDDGLHYKSSLRAFRTRAQPAFKVEIDMTVASLDLDADLVPADFVFTPPPGYVREDDLSKLMVEKSLEGTAAPTSH